jgi:hypothetical protein
LGSDEREREEPSEGIQYVVGLVSKSRLEKLAESLLERAKIEYEQTGRRRGCCRSSSVSRGDGREAA